MHRSIKIASKFIATNEQSTNLTHSHIPFSFSKLCSMFIVHIVLLPCSKASRSIGDVCHYIFRVHFPCECIHCFQIHCRHFTHLIVAAFSICKNAVTQFIFQMVRPVAIAIAIACAQFTNISFLTFTYFHNTHKPLEGVVNIRLTSLEIYRNLLSPQIKNIHRSKKEL